MEKFSLYEILGIILPGLVFLFFLDLLNDIWYVIPQNYLQFILGADWENLSIFFCFGFIFGMFFYTINFELVKRKWFNKLFGMYVPTADLYDAIKSLHDLNGILNKKAIEWFGREVFLQPTQFAKLNRASKEDIKKLQGEFYDRAYYELEYHDKISVAKSFQSFYFFFRQMVTVCSVLILFAAFIMIKSCFSQYIGGGNVDCPPYQETAYYILAIFLLLLLSRYLARWNRKRTVLKLYFSYFIHIQSSK